MGIYHATNLITKAFDEAGIKYEERCVGGYGPEEVKAAFAIHGGPQVIVRFISTDNNNDLCVRIISLLNNVAKEKRNRIMETCNYLNTKRRFLCFSIDSDGDLNVSYDFPAKTDDCCLGNSAIEIFLRIIQILQEDYPILMRALYTDQAIISEQPSDRKPVSMDQKETEEKVTSESAISVEEQESPSGLQELLLQRLSEDEDDYPSAPNE